MLGRGRMRRGVSLEVIVEEDDSAEVLLDPTPIMENDDEGHDEDDDEDDSENGSSTPGSPSGSGGEAGDAGGGGGGGGVGGGGRSDRGGGRSSGAEERRKRRERRKTIGGLSRMRSVSCEALTLLDTSDMDSCCSEWDDDDDMSTGSTNYVTLNRPISRRRILESSQSQCDSEDSGIEYQSNEDDPVLEDQSSVEDRKDADESSVDIHEQETATESDDEDDDETVSSEPPQDEALAPRSPVDNDTANADAHMDSNVEEGAGLSADVEAEAITDESADTCASTFADANSDASADISTYADADASSDAITDAGVSTDANTDAITDENADANADTTSMDANVEANPGTNMDANEDVLLSAKNGKHLFEERSRQGARQEHTTTAKYLQEYTANEVLENDKLVIVETTPPVPTRRPAATEGVVDAAEEEMQLKRAAYTIRNKEVQLEELPRPHTVRSVKQLFEDLKTPVGHFHAWRDLGRFRDIKSNPSSKILRFDRSDSIEAATSGSMGVGSSFTLPHPTRQHSRASAHTVESLTLPKVSQNSQHQQEMVTTKGGQSVMLRKPIVRGFNVKKALMEDPRTFQGHTRGSQTATATTSRQQSSNNNKQTTNHHNRKSHIHFAKKSHHLSDATTDRSDTESLASDISEDSGVSNDSNTSGSISTYRAFDAYASDPSFKWIDPAIMAKIRAVGTTVIFFGPRPRPRHQDGTVQKSVKSTPSGLKVSKGGVPASGVSAAGRTSSTTTIIRPAQKDVSRSPPVPAPRIVGVLRKHNPNTRGSPQPTSTESRASTPGRCQ